ncbi:phosphonate C-P lyase system protein PhnH [bacterium]|nr:phosphonate C-P lyase system protein PhnH [bacterium]
MYSQVYPTQKVFRVIVEAMSHPGVVYQLPTFQETHLWSTSLLAVAHTLLDHEVTFVYLGDEIFRIKEIFEATKSRQVALNEAHYIIIEGNRSNGRICEANCGSSTYPDRGATIIYILSENDDGSQCFNSSKIILKGPGIKESISPQMIGLNRDELVNIRDLNSEYPLGVDCIFLRGSSQVMCIPRSTRINLG